MDKQIRCGRWADADGPSLGPSDALYQELPKQEEIPLKEESTECEVLGDK